jgi:hypothetical protein
MSSNILSCIQNLERGNLLMYQEVNVLVPSKALQTLRLYAGELRGHELRG